ncbi:hypothetical protein [Nitrososphaera sp. AFS]|jgi:hypothetical protein|nr:hypothetical protein [Nitrososphaera sp. AFS]
MEIIESISWVASGFVPTLLLLEVSLRIVRKKPTLKVENIPLLTG